MVWRSQAYFTVLIESTSEESYSRQVGRNRGEKTVLLAELFSTEPVHMENAHLWRTETRASRKTSDAVWVDPLQKDGQVPDSQGCVRNYASGHSR